MLAIIPARAGSKGLPGKNIKDLLGKPLIAYSIEAALSSKSISRVIVSTDSTEIAEIAVNYGAECPFLRPAHLATDDSIAIDTYLYTIRRIEEEESIEIDEVCILLPTCPLRTAEDVDKASELFKLQNADSVVSYTQEHHPISWHRKIDADLKIEKIDTALLNRQSEEPTFFPNGAIFLFKTELLQSGDYYSENSYAYIMPRKRSVDVDTPDDFHYLEFLLRNQINE